MNNIKNVVVSNYIATLSISSYYAAGLNNISPDHCIVSVNGHIYEHTKDYTITPASYIVFNKNIASGTPIVIYAFEEATKTLSLTDKDNVSVISHISYTSDGINTAYKLIGPPVTAPNNCIVVIDGFIYQFNTDYTLLNNIVTFKAPISAGSVVSLYTFTGISSTKPVGGVSPKDNVFAITETKIIANGITNTYNITGASSNKSCYCLVFINDTMAESSVQYIISHNRVKFNKILPAGTRLRFYAFGAPKTGTPPPVPYERVRYLNKDANLNERTLFKNYWREQISHYGVTVNYYTSLTNNQNVDKIYGEAPVAGYSEPVELNVAVKADSETSMFSRFGLVQDSDFTCYMHHEDFQEIFGPQSEPVAGDLIEFTEIGIDRLNFPKRGPKIMEIVQKDDEAINEINNLAGHYVWMLKLKRFDYSKEFSMLPELGTKDAIYNGETIDKQINPYEELSKKVFDYEKNACSNDKVYGDY